MSEDLKNAFKRGVYFHAVGGALTHNAGCLIEGVIALGIPVKVCGPRITSRPVSMPLAGIDMTAYVAPLQSGMAAYIVDVTHTNAFAPLSSIGDGMVAYLNQGDVATFSKIPDDQLLFAAHESTFLNKGGARVPVAFGLSKGLIAATDNRPAFAAREAKALR
ncbi:MAG: hypothetical protein EXQ84_07685, partial [Rhodospirillaceae bacterium]|nr:hypothetical protein [Rhodospirillaceae bacterium]